MTATSRRFLELLRTAQLTSLLNGNTVFVPDNAAMQRFEANPQDEDALPDLLKGHIVQGLVSLESLRSSLRSGTRTLTLPTLKEGTSVTLSLDPSDNMTVNGNTLSRLKPITYQGAYLFQINAVLFTATENL